MTENTFSYALTNPLSSLLNKAPDEFQREDLMRIIVDKQIERITFHYIALDGRLKELKLPVYNRKRAERILAQGERVDGSSLFKGLVETSLSDLYVVPEYRTAFLNPFDAGSLDLICRYLTKDGERAPFTPDNILFNASRLFRERTGLDLYAMGELEFFLMSQVESNRYARQRQRGYHESSPFVKHGEVLTEILRYITQITHAVKYAHSEVGYIERVQSELQEINGRQAEQMEVEYLPRPIEEMADALVIGRWLVRNVAHRHGCVATFAPKIEDGEAGNGFHFHLQLRRDRNNVMEGPDGRLAEPAVRLVGGLCHYADTLTAFGNTVASSYLRLVPHQEAPTRIFWSGLNRSALIRVPLAWSEVKNISHLINPQERSDYRHPVKSKTVELRSPDGSALIHLLLAGVAMAGEWGFSQPGVVEMAEKLYVSGRSGVEADVLEKFAALPPNCLESSRLLREKRGLYERENIFPTHMIDYIARLLEEEHTDVSGITDKDELRRIMHRDLHKH